MATVTLENVKKSFGRVEVIRGIDAKILDGEFIVIVGPSGCGKSTLLRMIAGLESVTSGSIFIDGDFANHKEPMDRDIAMVFQNYALYPHMTVAQNMGYGLKIAGFKKSIIEMKITKAAQMLQLENLLNRRPKQLSGGQRQRVAMGRAIVRSPTVFLFDEPLSNLDAKLRVQMRLEIKALQAQIGTTSLYVTHDQVEAMTMADRMIVMNAGYAEQIGSPLEVYEYPQTLFAAQFIGSPAMNIIDTYIEGGKIILNERVLDSTNVRDGAVKLGIRPEHVAIDINGMIKLNVQLSEPLGANTLFYGQLEGSNCQFVASLAGIHKNIKINHILNLTVQENHYHFFDPDTKNRL